nr:NtaA/DmoA family FMN-dependent monooxygenase [Kineococcus aurantiacus]
MGWFTNYLPPSWKAEFSGRAADTWMSGDFHVNLARRLEEARFDYLLLEDSSYVSNTYGGSFELELQQVVRAPKNDPMPLAAAIARETRHLGLVVTANTTFYPPFLLARLIRTLDHLSRGRAGWNVVTGAPDQALANFGIRDDALRDGVSAHDLRYDMAEEFVDLVVRLWESWEEDAVVADRATGTYVDAAKVRTVDFEGKWYSSRGPLNSPPSPQYRPVICQAGGSARGRAFAGRHADTVVALPKGVEQMRAHVDDVRRAAEAAGRDPAACKVLFIVTPTIAETDAEARASRDRQFARRDERALRRLAMMSGGGVDWSGYDLDAPLPALAQDGQSTTAEFARRHAGKTFRDALAEDQTESVELVGSPDTVAAQMVEALEATGGDGFLFYSGSGELTMRFVDEVVDGVVPALQRAGHARREYSATTLAGHLGDGA